MAIPVNPDDLLNGTVVESARIELKENFNPDPIVHTICAFANDIDNIGGGYIFIGVEEKHGLPVHPISGLPQEKLDDIQLELLRCCHFIEPLLIPEIQVTKIDDQFVLLVRVAGGYGRPYKARVTIPKKKKDKKKEDSHQAELENHEKKYYIRKGSSTIAASPQEEAELFYISSSIPFDDRPNLLAHLEDLSLERMREHLRLTGSTLTNSPQELSLRRLAEDLQIVEGPEEDLRPRNVGILMFGKEPQKFFRYARIELVWIPDPGGSGMEEQVFEGPLQNQLKEALDVIQARFLREKIIKQADQAQSARIWNYPYPAVQEILANAVYHKSYQVSEPITVRITETEIEITSHPGFDRSIRDEDIEARRIRSRVYRNRRIGDFLKELHLIEGRNTGFPNARRALQKNGSPDLRLVMDEDRQFLSVILDVHPAFAAQEPRKVKEQEYAARIVALIREQPDSLSHLAQRMGYKGITAKLSRVVNELTAQGRLEKTVQNGRVLLTDGTRSKL